jgi:hypothetical protein
LSRLLFWIGLAAAGAIVLWTVDRLALWAESRGWIYYRRTNRRTGANLGDAFLEIQSMLEPDKRHLLEIRREEKSEQSETGDPPDDPAAGPGERGSNAR